MTATWRALRRRILTPNNKETKLSTRGFHAKNPEAKANLERVGETFLIGYGYAAEARSIAEAEENLDTLEPAYRGFAYEGAGMGFAMRDGLPLKGTDWTERFLASEGAAHVYMIYVGAGWALARLPRFRWAKATAALTDPVLRYLALDGYGFHQAFFHTEKYVHQQYSEPNFPWPPEAPSGYADRAIDQGIGRATWFVCGSDPHRVADTLDAFPAQRRPDLYAGAGLASTYAGGADESELRAFMDRSGPYLAQLVQGSAFAATARVKAGLVIPHTNLAARVICGTDPDTIAGVCDDALRDLPVGGEVPAFEIWRQRISDGILDLRSKAA